MEETRPPLADRRVLVVGASSGIGQGIACALSAAGANVALAARRLDRLEETAERCPGPAVSLRCDVTEPGASTALVDDPVEALGGLEAVVSVLGMDRRVLISEMVVEPRRA
jgi:NAD(P)-dependent dehydrogenase (short-subunit alcohol dehydrogenase family)